MTWVSIIFCAGADRRKPNILRWGVSDYLSIQRDAAIVEYDEYSGYTHLKAYLVDTREHLPALPCNVEGDIKFTAHTIYANQLAIFYIWRFN